ncbi:MAG: hypothetical protein ACLT8E_08660 [Akkermansia sp.]
MGIGNTTPSSAIVAVLRAPWWKP